MLHGRHSRWNEICDAPLPRLMSAGPQKARSREDRRADAKSISSKKIEKLKYTVRTVRPMVKEDELATLVQMPSEMAPLARGRGAPS